MVIIFGKSAKEISEQFNVSRATLYRLYRKGGESAVFDYFQDKKIKPRSYKVEQLKPRKQRKIVIKEEPDINPIALTLISIAVVLVVYFVTLGS